MAAIWKICAPVAFLLTFATWLFFTYGSPVAGLQLSNPQQIAFVFGFWFVLAVVVRWLVRLVRKPQGGTPHDPSET